MTNAASALAKLNAKKVVMDGTNVIVTRLVAFVKYIDYRLEFEEGTQKLKSFIGIQHKVIWLIVQLGPKAEH